MRILILTTHFNHGGITSYIINLVQGLKSRGHKVFVASCGGSCLGRLDKLGVQHVRIPIRTKSELSPKIILSFMKLTTFLRENDIQVIHSQTRVTQVLGQIMSFFSGVSFVSTCHGFFKARLSRRFFPCWGKYVIAISQPVKEHLVKDMKVKEEYIKIIHHGINIINSDNKSSSSFKEVLGFGKNSVVGIIARLSEVKGHKYLITAFTDVLKELPDAKLLMVGEGRLKNELGGLVRNLGLQKSAIFMPSVDDTSILLSAMDIFVMPSVQEGLGLSIMEAQAFGVPVVAFDVGGIKSLIKNNQTGILVDFPDVASLAREIIRLLKDMDLRNRIIQNAQDFIKANFSLDKMVKETEEVYAQVAS